MDIKLKLMQKNGLMAMNLAKEFLSMEEGERIITVAQMAENYKTARGTIQSALKFLQDYGAISLEPRGHLGTFINKISYSKLLEIADIKTIVGVMPLPYSKVYEGLATGLYNTLGSTSFNISLAYMRGANSRLQALIEGRYDFAVISKLAAQHYINSGEEIEVVLNFGPHSYVNEHVIIFKNVEDSEIKDGMRIGIDYSSLDHQILSFYQCEGKNVQYVPLLYSQLLNKILSGEIDAAIWNIDAIKESNLSFNYYTINNEKFNYSDTEAVVIVKKSNEYLAKLLKKFLDESKILDIQRKVVNEQMVPNY
ncbi:GntR family transcriptional regulator YhfZ [Clostridium sp. OS1-26]|uniref:GntR family transcriptional regulator YhfZ n=1 Tax=Clostridium sp. OS1-26 TaxID=3070681 RepID=UPI0027E04E7E|nr:GntR family transcriptional regulator YhfZ [Clostridium sp. OS1-26]WML34930.1 GntR family transcriptional regulator YhfZ [Clostridium sp. OS1-26]